MSALATFQDRFADAVHGRAIDDAMAALVAQPAFAIYRNTALSGCIDALEANFPAVACLVGREWLRAAAAAYAAAYPPDDARMLFYGRDFPRFLADHEFMHGLAYLADVARIDRLWTEASAASDAATINLAALRTVPPADLPRVRLERHPATRWQRFGVPACTIWQASRQGMAVAADLDWHAECSLVTRAEGSVDVTAISPAACALLDACAGGHALQEAIAQVAAIYPDSAMQNIIATLFHAGAFAALSIPPLESP